MATSPLGANDTIATKLPKDLGDRLRQLAKQEELSVSWLARRAIREYLERVEAAA
jgi:predicted transcriptional regulator